MNIENADSRAKPKPILSNFLMQNITAGDT